MKRLTMLFTALCLLLALALPASALEYIVDAPQPPSYGKPTSVEHIYTPDRGEASNVDVGKDAALFPPPVGGIGCPAGPPATAYTALTDGLIYEDGSLGRLTIPRLGVDVKVVQGTDSAALAQGAGHFEASSAWTGNVCLAGHNRGSHAVFGAIHTLAAGNAITFTTKLGSRTYYVVSVRKISEWETSVLNATADDRLTLITCVSGQPQYRWCVQAVELV